MQPVHREKHSAERRQPITLSVIIPCYNERNHIEEVLNRVEDVELANEIIIVDDGSTDGTREVLKRIESEIADHPNLRILYHEHNMGKGAAVITGFRAATCQVLLIQDADFEYDPREYLPVRQQSFSEPRISRRWRKLLSGSIRTSRISTPSRAASWPGRF